MLVGGANVAEILSDYEFLEEADIRACIEYAAAKIDHLSSSAQAERVCVS
jgi:uncharacterized protein (DUF433 family)